MAYENDPSSWDVKESSEVVFSENEGPTAENNYSLCKVCVQSYLLYLVGDLSYQLNEDTIT